MKLADVLGVDALVVGSITTYDPYDPRIGFALTLLPRTTSMNGVAPAPKPLDPRELQTSPTEVFVPAPLGEPASTVSELYDGKNQAIQMDLKTYAEGRADKTSAVGWRRYLRSVDLFAQFAAYRIVDELVQLETIRLGRALPSPKQGGGKTSPPVATAARSK
jgi:hypothetical protein